MQWISVLVKEAYRGRFLNQVSPTAFWFFTHPSPRACGSVLGVLALSLKGETKLYVSSSVTAGGVDGFGNLGPELCHQDCLLHHAREGVFYWCLLYFEWQKIAHRMACRGDQHCKWVWFFPVIVRLGSVVGIPWFISSFCLWLVMCH